MTEIMTERGSLVGGVAADRAELREVGFATNNINPPISPFPKERERGEQMREGFLLECGRKLTETGDWGWWRRRRGEYKR